MNVYGTVTLARKRSLGIEDEAEYLRWALSVLGRPKGQRLCRVTMLPLAKYMA